MCIYPALKKREILDMTKRGYDKQLAKLRVNFSQNEKKKIVPKTILQASQLY